MIKFGYFSIWLFVLGIMALGLSGPSCSGENDNGRSVDVHDEASEHAGQEAEENHDEDESKAVHIAPENIADFGIVLKTAGPGKLKISISLPGEISADPSRLVHIVPRISGVAREIRKTIGDLVSKGELIAVLESRELSDLKSAYLIAKEDVVLAKSTFQREEKLWEKKISSERTYLEARNKLAEARINLESAAQKLHALGFSKKVSDATAKNSAGFVAPYSSNTSLR